MDTDTTIMTSIENMNFPRVLSQDERRAWYAIPLREKRAIDERYVSGDIAERVPEGYDAHSTISRCPVSTASSQNQSDSSASLFSTQAQTASSATSISEDSVSDTLTTCKQTDRPCVSGVHSGVVGLCSSSEEEGVGITQAKSRTVVETTTPVGNDIEHELSALRSIRSKLSCQQCRTHELGCDGASPSCWNCVQTYQQCCYRGTNTSSLQGNIQSHSIWQERILDFPSWEGSLRDHPYYSVEGGNKLGRVRMRSLRLRRGLPQKAVSTKNPGLMDMEHYPEDDDKLLLVRCSSDPFDDGDSAPSEDTLDDTSSVGSSLSTFVPSYYSSLGPPSRNSSVTIPLDLGVVSSLDLLAQPTHSSKESILTSSNRDSQGPWEDDEATIEELIFESQPFHNAKGYRGRSSRQFTCIFCFQQFGSYENWSEHERLEHFDTERDWICMPWGSIVESDDNTHVCAFCGTVDQEGSSHCSQHNEEPCLRQPVEDRTYRSKDDFQEHLWNHHNQQTISVWMEKWSYPPKDDAYYWQCGFCDRLLSRWSERAIHIGNHFKIGTAISCWNPLVPPYPISKATGTRAPWVSAVQWDPRTFLTPELSEYNQFNGDDCTSNCHQCHHCNLGFGNERDAKRHQEVWHLSQDVWSCPTMDDVRAATYLQAGPMAWYLFQSSPLPILCEEDICPYCGDLSEMIFEDYGEDITECSADWDIRIQHLKHDHGMDKCQPTVKFNRVDHFLLHLANCHNVRLTDWTRDVVDSCKRQKRMPPRIKKGSLVECTDEIV